MSPFQSLRDMHAMKADGAVIILAVVGAVGLFVTIGLCVSLIAFLARAGG